MSLPFPPSQQTQHASANRWVGETRHDQTPTGYHTGHRLGARVLLHLERCQLDWKGKRFACVCLVERRRGMVWVTVMQY